MSEVSIAKALSGGECLEAILSKVRSILSKDDRFQSHMGYTGFRATIRVEFHPSLSFVPSVEREVEIEEGSQDEITPEPTVSETIELPIAPPNAVREEAGLPTPVLVTDGQGRSHEEWVKRGTTPKSSVIPKNKVIGG